MEEKLIDKSKDIKEKETIETIEDVADENVANQIADIRRQYQNMVDKVVEHGGVNVSAFDVDLDTSNVQQPKDADTMLFQ